MNDLNYMLKEDLHELHLILDDMRKYQQKQSSLRWNFWRGVFYGFGFFIGSAILVSALAYVLKHIGADGNTTFGRIIKDVVELFQSTRR